jgi:3-dehydroquinate synthase
VKDSSNAVRRFAAQGGCASGVTVELGTPRDQFMDIRGTLAHEHVHRVRETETIPGGNRVAGVKLRRVVSAECRGDSALSIPGVAFGGTCLREYDDVSMIRQRQRGAQARDAAPDDQEIPADLHGCYPINLSAPHARPRALQPAHVLRHVTLRALRMNTDGVSALTRVDVTAGTHGSTIWIGNGVSAQVGDLLDAQHVGGRRFVVSSPGIWKLHGARFRGLSQDEPILISDGERFKTLRSVSKIYEALIRAGADRGSTLVAVGGGVIGDTAGFAAASYLRGITLVHVPTTLLAQVDSSIGGKVGVNHALGKNLIGAFHQPRLVAIDPTVLSTLPRREFRSGLYEVVKYGVIADRALFERLATHTKRILAQDPDVLLPSIIESCRIKADVVSRDEREGGLRRILNFGHTVGHALESVTRYRTFRHGEAIAWGMRAAALLAASRGVLPQSECDAIIGLIRGLGSLPPVDDLSMADILGAIGRDKKVVHGRLHFVLATAIGATTTVDDVTEDELRHVLGGLGLKDTAGPTSLRQGFGGPP